MRREGDGYVSLCPELDIASQGGSVEEATGIISEKRWSSFILKLHHPRRLSNVFMAKIFETQVEVVTWDKSLHDPFPGKEVCS